jgi:hypothetical protein
MGSRQPMRGPTGRGAREAQPADRPGPGCALGQRHATSYRGRAGRTAAIHAPPTPPSPERTAAPLQQEHSAFKQPLVISAYHLAARAHAGQQRKNGDPVLQHCVNTAIIVAKLVRPAWRAGASMARPAAAAAAGPGSACPDAEQSTAARARDCWPARQTDRARLPAPSCCRACQPTWWRPPCWRM